MSSLLISKKMKIEDKYFNIFKIDNKDKIHLDT